MVEEKGKVCGRNKKSSTLSSNEEVERTVGFQFKGAVATFVNLLALTTVVGVQAMPTPQIDYTVVSTINGSQEPIKSKKEPIVIAEKQLKEIKGVVKHKGEVLYGATVLVGDGIKYSTKTDLSGKFEFALSKDFSENKILLKVTLVGFKDAIVEVKNFTQDIVVQMEKSEELMGEMVIEKRVEK